MDMPTFPKVDLTDQISWAFDGITTMFTSNIPIVIGAAVGLTLLTSVVVYAKRMATSAVH